MHFCRSFQYCGEALTDRCPPLSALWVFCHWLVMVTSQRSPLGKCGYITSFPSACLMRLSTHSLAAATVSSSAAVSRAGSRRFLQPRLKLLCGSFTSSIVLTENDAVSASIPMAFCSASASLRILSLSMMSRMVRRASPDGIVNIDL